MHRILFILLINHQLPKVIYDFTLLFIINKQSSATNFLQKASDKYEVPNEGISQPINDQMKGGCDPVRR